jgi:hypothetical protein
MAEQAVAGSLAAPGWLGGRYSARTGTSKGTKEIPILDESWRNTIGVFGCGAARGFINATAEGTCDLCRSFLA